jgi:hypothetical protein
MNTRLIKALLAVFALAAFIPAAYAGAAPLLPEQGENVLVPPDETAAPADSRTPAQAAEDRKNKRWWGRPSPAEKKRQE